MSQSSTPLKPGFESEYANRLIGVDTLWGGDILDANGTSHVIVDTYPRDFQPPESYRDPRAHNIRQAGGVQAGSRISPIISYIQDYELDSIREWVVSALEQDPYQPRDPQARWHRLDFIKRTGDALAIQVRTAVARLRKKAMPYYSYRYHASSRQDPDLADPDPLVQELRDALYACGFLTGSYRDLRLPYQAWRENLGHVDFTRFSHIAHHVRDELATLFQLHFCDDDSSELELAPDDLQFDRLQFVPARGLPYLISNTYQVGVDAGGRPVTNGLIQYNADHPVSNAGIWGLVGREMMRYLDIAVANLRYRRGQLGIEAVIGTRCTASMVLRHGFAQNALPLIFDTPADQVVAKMSRVGRPDQAVQFAMEKLEAVGRNNASVLFHYTLSPLPARERLSQIKRYLAGECKLPDRFIHTLMANWVRHPITGPMHSPAYYHGGRLVADAIRRQGPLAVLQACLHRHGYMDGPAFADFMGEPPSAG